ncbi:MAG: hypothetical protein KF686_16910 [Ramlibacter sp.]|nr:hypothetical protein [Ramlibacter sp.]
MKFDIRRIFARSGDPVTGGSLDDGADTDYLPANGGGDGLETDYQAIIASHFRRWGIDNQCVTVEVKKMGQAPDGYDVFVGMVRLVRWERTSGLRILLGLPLLEAKIRKTVRATWLADYSHFTGLWLHASEQLQLPDELRELLGSLAPLTPHASAGHAGAPDSVSQSLPRASLPASGPAGPDDTQEAAGAAG